MKQHQLSAVKRLTKPILFGTLIVGLATAFFNRRWFFQDVEVLRAQERERNEAKRMEVLERRMRQIDEVAKRKSAALHNSSDSPDVDTTKYITPCTQPEDASTEDICTGDVCTGDVCNEASVDECWKTHIHE